MEQTTKVEIIRELMRQLDEHVNVDAGVQYRNPTSAYTSQDLAKQETGLPRRSGTGPLRNSEAKDRTENDYSISIQYGHGV